jgi:DNA-binding SARP family transcriptional activator
VAESPAALQLRLSGAPQWQRGDTGAQPLAAADALMLAWLALEGPTTRERLAALLWPDSPPEAARNTLRQRLFRLRRALGVDAVAGSAVLSLAEGVAHDLGDTAGAGGTLLAGLGPAAEAADAPLGDWLAQQRRRRGAWRRQALLERIEALEASGEPGPALPLARELLALDPLAEDSHRRVMRLLYLQGDRAAALRAFDELEQRLKHELGTRPGAETLALLASIEAEAAPALAAHEAFAPTAPTQRPLPVAVLRPPRLVGRQGEFRQLHERWLGGAGGPLALVVGEAGMGKSRLLAALAESGAAVLASARPGDTLVSFSSLGRLLRAWGNAGRDAAARLGAEHRAALAALMPDWPSPERSADAPPRTSVAEALRALVAAASDGGTAPALVLDDLHFADEATLALLPEWLAAAPSAAPAATAFPTTGAPPRIALGTRPAAPGSALGAVLDALAQAQPDGLRLELQPLTVAELAELVDSLGLPQARGEELAPLLRQHSGGNPLFALETLKSALKSGLAGAGGGAWALATALPKPESLRQLIQQQLARLSPPALTLARLAALAGPDFSLPLAADVLGQHPLALADPWAELEAQQVLLDDGSFAHDLVFEAVLGAVPGLIARHLHARIAQALETIAGAGGPTGGTGPETAAAVAPGAAAVEPARIAHHWEAAGQPPRALPHWRAAAEQAHRAWREDERIAFLLRAADIAEAAGQREPAFDSIARALDAHMDVLRDTRGLALLDRLDRLASTAGERALAASRRAWYLVQLAGTPDHAEAARLGAQALALAEAAGDTTLAETTREQLGTTLSLLGRFDEALAHLERVRPWAEAHFGAEALASYHGNLAVVLDNLGRPQAALEHHQAAIAASAAIGDRSQQVTHQSNLAVNRLNAGDAAAALAAAEAGQHIVGAVGLAGSSVAFLHAVQAQAARALGRWRLARSATEAALEQLAQHHPGRAPMVLLHRALLALELGQHQAAAQDLQRIAEAAGRLPAHLRARHALLQARWQLERGLDARAATAQALALAPANGWPEVRMAAQLQAARLEPPAARQEVAQQVARDAAALGLHGSVLAARLLLADTLQAGGAGDAALAAALASELAAQIEHCVPTLRPRAEVWLGLARAWHAAGADEAAAAAASAGRAWLQQRLADELDTAAERSAAAERCPAHRALLLSGEPGLAAP